MKYLHNAWYPTGWSSDLDEWPVARTLLEERIAIVRESDGTLMALQDRCPHRAASLSDGSLQGNALACPYHALRFDRTGRCLGGPSDFRSIPSTVRVRSYPIAERHRMAWVWMGDPDRADPAAIPDFSAFDDVPLPAFAWGYMHVLANYQLISDNLLDLSHIPFLHANTLAAGSAGRVNASSETRAVPGGVEVTRSFADAPVNILYKTAWPHPRGDRWADMTWYAPSTLLLRSGITGLGQPRSEGLHMPTGHLLAPETATSTHYFWAMGRSFDLDNADLTTLIARTGATAFGDEDKPMVEAQQRNLAADAEGARLQNLTTGDYGAVLARRHLKALLDDEP